MFKWKDYEENAALFIDGISENVAILRYKDFQLTDAATGLKVKMKSSNIDEAKVDAENLLPRPVNKPLDEKDFGPVKLIRNCKYSLNKRKKLNYNSKKVMKNC